MTELSTFPPSIGIVTEHLLKMETSEDENGLKICSSTVGLGFFFDIPNPPIYISLITNIAKEFILFFLMEKGHSFNTETLSEQVV